MWDKIKSSLPGKWPATSQLSTLSAEQSALPPEGQPLPKANSANSASSNWRLACDAYRQQVNLSASPIKAAPFAAFGSLHVAVADMLHERGDEMRQQGEQRIVHIAGAAGLLAVYSPKQRLVQLRTQQTALGQLVQTHELVMRVMPASAQPLEGAAARGFQAVPLAALMWYFGQSAVRSLLYLPDLKQQILRIRRFPPLEPASLQLRHLRLIHVLSQGSYSFESLQAALSQEQIAMLCPDLASLYFTGALSLK